MLFCANVFNPLNAFQCRPEKNNQENKQCAQSQRSQMPAFTLILKSAFRNSRPEC